MLNLPTAAEKYDKTNEQNMRNTLRDADAQNVKQGQEWNAVRLVLTDTVTSARYQVTVASGVLTLVLL